MKILFLTAEGFDTPNPNNQMAETMIDEFIRNGYDVHLIQSHRKGINPDIPNRLKNRIGLTVDTIVRKVTNKTHFIERYLNDITYAIQAKKYWRKVKDADVVYLQSNPTIVFPMFLLRFFYKKPIVYSIYDVFPGHAYDIGIIKSKFLYDCFRILQKPCYCWADAIVVLGEDMKDKVLEQGAKSDKIWVVPAWYDVSNIKYIPKNENRFLQKNGISMEKFIVQFAGSLGYVFNADTVLKLSEKLSYYKNIEIQIIGDGSKKDYLIKTANSRNLSNINFFPLQPLEMVADVYNACDVCLIPLMKGVIGNGVPSKAAILMACGKVIINSVEKSSKYAQMFADNNMGIAVNIDDIDGLVAVVIDLYNHPKKIEVMAKNSNEFGKINYSSSRNIKKLMQIFDACKKVS